MSNEQFTDEFVKNSDGNLTRKLFIYWVNLNKENILIGQITNTIVDGKEIYYTISYYEDTLKELLKYEDSFSRISGCPYEYKTIFEYKNRLPVFIEERTPNASRADLPELLAKIDMKYYDRFEYMKRTHACCVNNRYFVHESDNAYDYKGSMWHII